MAEKRLPEFSVLLRYRGKSGIKIEFFGADQWPDKGGVAGLYRLKMGMPIEDRPGEFSEAWHPGPRKYVFLTEARAWELVAGMAGQGTAPTPDAPELSVGTPVRVPNGNILAGVVQYDITRTVTAPVRLIDGRDYVVVPLIGRGAVHVPMDQLQIIGRKP